MTVAQRPTMPYRVLANGEAAAEQRLLVLDAGEAAGHYTTAGQLVEVEDAGGRAYMVIASALTTLPHLELLVRQGRGEVGDRMAKTPVGATMEMTRPFGPGFRLERAGERRLVCCVAGTGIAAVRPVLHELAANRADLQGVELLYGVLTRAHLAFRSELEAWQRLGLRVRVCVSDEQPHEPWDRAGWVQAVLATEDPDLSDVAILFAGPREMGPELQAVAAAAGMPAGMMLTNF